MGIREEVVLVDCRCNLTDPDAGARDYAQGHIPGAAFFSLTDDLSTIKTGTNGRHPLPSPEEFAARLAGLGATEKTLVIAYDASGGMYASRLWWMCRWIGHLKCGVLDGGIQAWQAEGGPLVTEPFQSKGAGRITVRPSLSPLWTVEHVKAWVDAGSDQELALLLDARAPERFRGEQETLDPVAGHIPGARNRPFTENLAPGGCFKKPSELHAEFTALLHGTDPMSVVHSCGSGVTACHNLLAMEIAGLHGSSLYAGAWSEWCSDRSRPVATGPA